MAVFLHLGAHKTATTHLQGAFRAAAPALAAHGVRWFGPGRFRGPGALPLKAVAEAGPQAPGAARLARVLGGARSAAQDGRLIVSEENLLGPALRPAPGAAPALYAHAERRLGHVLAATGLGGGPGSGGVTLCLAVRAPCDWVVSNHSQRASTGRWMAWEAFADGVEPAALRWSGLVARLLAVPGVSGALVWAHEDYPAVFPSLLQRLLPEAARPLVVPAPRRANEGLSAAALAHIAAHSPGRTLEARRALVAEARARFPRGPDAPGFDPWPPAVREAAAAAHAADLERLRALPGVVWLAPPGRAGASVGAAGRGLS